VVALSITLIIVGKKVAAGGPIEETPLPDPAEAEAEAEGEAEGDEEEREEER
jgi:hypothetical protein